MSNPVSDYPDWLRTVVFIPPPVHTPPPPVTLGGGNVGIGANWQLVISGTLKIVRWTISNPHRTDGSQAGSTAEPQDSVWVQYVDTGGTPPDNGVIGGIYLPSPGFMYEDGWSGDVYMTKAGEVAETPVVSTQLILSTYP